MQTDYRVASNKPQTETKPKEKPKFQKVVDGATVEKHGLLSMLFKDFIKEDASTVFT